MDQAGGLMLPRDWLHLYAQAIAQFLEQQPQNHITNQLNKVYGEESSKLDSKISTIQFLSVGKEKWK